MCYDTKHHKVEPLQDIMRMGRNSCVEIFTKQIYSRIAVLRDE